MNYHDIRDFDMLNGEGVRVVLFVSGCSHHCKGCHNPETWDPGSGILFDRKAMDEILKYLEKDYISGLTLSGGDPLFEGNLPKIKEIIKEVKSVFPDKNIWLYTGYTIEEIEEDEKRKEIAEMCDVIVDGEFIEDLADVNYPFAGSTNQRIIKRRSICIS